MSQKTHFHPDYTRLGIGMPLFYKPFLLDAPPQVKWLSSGELFRCDGRLPARYERIEDINTSAFTTLSALMCHSTYMMIWLPKGWKESWIDLKTINAQLDHGKIPVFLHWYFGDSYRTHAPDETAVKAYYDDLIRLNHFLNDINGPRIVMLEPEFNKEAFLRFPDKTVTIFKTAISILKYNSSHQTYVGISLIDIGRKDAKADTNCGYPRCSLGDKASWDKSDAILRQLSTNLDMIGFAEMTAQFSRNPADPGTYSKPNAIRYTRETSGIDDLAQRIVNYTDYLHFKYGLPVFLSYLGLPTATWNDKDLNGKIALAEVNASSGWESKASAVYAGLSLKRSELERNGLFGLAPMNLFDDPCHDRKGYRYYLQNEAHLGILKYHKTKMRCKKSGSNPTTGDYRFKGSVDASLLDLALPTQESRSR